MVVRQEVERHGRDFSQQLVERGRVSSGRDVVAVPAPDGDLLVPDGGDGKDRRFGHGRRASLSRAEASLTTMLLPLPQGGRRERHPTLSSPLKGRSTKPPASPPGR